MARPGEPAQLSVSAQLYRVGGTDAHEAVVSQLRVGATTFRVADESPPHASFSPESPGGGSVRMLLTVPDPIPSSSGPGPHRRPVRAPLGGRHAPDRMAAERGLTPNIGATELQRPTFGV